MSVMVNLKFNRIGAEIPKLYFSQYNNVKNYRLPQKLKCKSENMQIQC